MENLITTYKLPKHYFSEVFCIIIIYLQHFQILKQEKSLWRPYLSPLYKILAHYLPDLKLSPLT